MMNNNEMEEASVEDIDEYLSVYYEDKMELKIAVTRKILLLTLDMKNIEFLLNHGSFIYKNNNQNDIFMIFKTHY